MVGTKMVLLRLSAAMAASERKKPCSRLVTPASAASITVEGSWAWAATGQRERLASVTMAAISAVLNSGTLGFRSSGFSKGEL